MTRSFRFFFSLRKGAKGFVIMLTVALFFATASGEENVERPKVGLALSGGGAKGFAHIGVLKVLEEVGLPIDYITGTSMGAIVGAMYSIGYSPREMERVILSTDWDYLFSDQVDRKLMTMEQKQWQDRYLTTLWIDGLKIKLPSGLITGQNISKMMCSLSIPYHSQIDFHQFPIPFACLGTDLVTGDITVFSRGFLPEALRASMSIPTIFSPMEIGDNIYVDGGIVRNFPVVDVKEMGADIIIGVNVGDKLKPREKLDSIIEVMNQSMLIFGSRTGEQSALCDILLEPEFEDNQTIADFNDARLMINLGEAAARKQIRQLRLLADSLRPPEPQHLLPRIVFPDSFYIVQTEIEGLENVTPRVVNSELEILLPQWMTVAEIEAAVDRVYRTDFFKRVTYRLIPNEGVQNYRLICQVEEKKGHLFRVGLNYNSTHEAAFILNAHFRNLAHYASILNIDFRLAQDIHLAAQHFLHIGLINGFGFMNGASYTENRFSIYNDGHRTMELKLDHQRFESFIGTLFHQNLSAGGLLQYESVTIDPRISQPDVSETDLSYVTLSGQLHYDTLEQTTFPRNGQHLVVRATQTVKSTDNQVDYFLLAGVWQGYFPLHRCVTLTGQAGLGITQGDHLPIHKHFYLGGLYTPVILNEGVFETTFYGADNHEFSGRHFQMIQTGLQYEFDRNKFAALKINAGLAADDFDDLFLASDFATGLGLTIGIKTLMGPIEWSIMTGSEDRFSSHINLGYRF